MVVAPDIARQIIGRLIFSSSEAISAFGDPAVSYIALVHGVLGAVMIGWGVALLFLMFGPFRRGSRESWLTIAISLAAWFVPDIAFSLWHGFWQNAVVNSAFAVLFAIPLVATYGVCCETRT